MGSKILFSKVLFLFVFIVPILSWASHFESCEFDTELISIDAQIPQLGKTNKALNTRDGKYETDFLALTQVKILRAKKRDGSYVDCQAYVGKTKALILTELEALELKVGQNVKFDFDLGHNETANSEFYDIKWDLID